MNTIKVSGTGSVEQRVASLEQAVNYGEVVLPFPVIGEVEGTGGGTAGPPGPAGPAGADGATGATGPAGPGVAPGGTTGQHLAKTSSVDYATAWVTPGVTMSATAPATVVPGDLWWRTTDGNLYVFYDDGTSTQFVPAMAGGGQQYYLIAGACAGVPTASLVLGLYVVAVPNTLPIGLTGSQGVAKVAATAQTDCDLKVNGVSQGTLRWAAAATVATFLFTAAVALAVGDRVEVVAPATPDTTLADVAWTLKGTL